MPAPNRATLYDVEDAVESAARTLLNAASPGCAVFIQREVVDLPDSRIDVRLELSQSVGEREYAWMGQLIFAVITDRTIDAYNVHGLRRGTVRASMPRVTPGLNYHQDFTEDVLPYHVINRLTQAGTIPQAQITEDVDMSQLIYDVVISVRPGAFPAVDGSVYFRPDGTALYFRPDGVSLYFRP